MNEKLHGKCVLAPFYGTQLFGRERENIECFKALMAMGYDVKVVCSSREIKGGSAGAIIESLGLKVGEIEFGSHFSISYFKSIKGYWHRQIKRIWNCSRFMRQKEKECHPDFIFIGGTMEFLYLWPWLLFTKVPLIFRVEDGPIWNSKFHLNAYRQLLMQSNLILCCSKFIQKECEKLLPISRHERLFHLPNCAPKFEPDSAANQETVRKKSEVSNENLQLLYVGQITANKGIVELIEAMRSFAGNPVELIIVGGSKSTSKFASELQMQTEVEKLNVRWIGKVNDPTPFYDSADVHIAPSVYEEPFGLVVVEAKRSRVPSIIFPSGGMQELVNHEVDGWICEDKSAGALVKSIELAMLRRDELETMGERAYVDFEHNYSFERFVLNFKAILNNAVIEKE